MDKSASYTPRGDDIYHVTAFLAAARDRVGMTNPQIDRAMGYNGMAGHWTSNKSQPAVPTPENWFKLKELLKFDDQLDDEIMRLNGRKGQPGDEWFNRPIIGWENDGVAGHVFAAAGANPTYKTTFAITEAVTDAAKEWEGWNTGLKPGAEHWIMAQKPMTERNYANNILRYGVGGLNVKGCAVDRVPESTRFDPAVHYHDGYRYNSTGAEISQVSKERGWGWPANVVMTATDGPDCPAVELDSQSGGASRYFNQFAFGPEDLPSFFYYPKATRQEKEAGVQEAGIEPRVMKRVNDGGLENEPRFAPKLVYNDHPTVKSIALMRWLIRLVVRQGGTVADFFCGSGTTACAAILEGNNFIGFDLEARNVAISQARASYWQHQAQQVADGALPALTLRSAPPAAPKRTSAGKPPPALSFEDLFDEEGA